MLANKMFQEIISRETKFELLEYLIEEGAVPTTKNICDILSNSLDVEAVKILIKHVPADYECFEKIFTIKIKYSEGLLELVGSMKKVVEVLLTNYKLTNDEKVKIVKLANNINNDITMLLMEEFIKGSTNDQVEISKNSSLAEVKKLMDIYYHNKEFHAWGVMDTMIYEKGLDDSEFLRLCKSGNHFDVLNIAPYVSKTMLEKGIDICKEIGRNTLVSKLSDVN